MEYLCKDCASSDGDLCKWTGAAHTTGITCPSFEAKEEEKKMGKFNIGDKVRVLKDIPEICLGCSTGVTLKKGTEGEITAILVDIVQVRFGSSIWGIDPLTIELVEPECTFVGYPEGVLEIKDPSMESYKSGATRTQCETKIDPEGFFSPLVVLRYSEYMHKCRVQADGTLRDSDNWQGGIPLWRYMKGKWRHFLDTWLIHRGYKKVTDEGLDLQDCLCAEMFNTMGYLHEMLCEEKGVTKDQDAPVPGGAHANFKDRTAPVERGC